MEKEPDLAALSEGTLAAVKALGLKEPVDYIGHHTGGQLFFECWAFDAVSDCERVLALKASRWDAIGNKRTVGAGPEW